MKIPLHHNKRGDKPWTSRAAEKVDLWSTMASLNPNGFRQPRTGKHRRAKPETPTMMDRIFDLDAKLA